LKGHYGCTIVAPRALPVGSFSSNFSLHFAQAKILLACLAASSCLSFKQNAPGGFAFRLKGRFAPQQPSFGYTSIYPLDGAAAAGLSDFGGDLVVANALTTPHGNVKSPQTLSGYLSYWPVRTISIFHTIIPFRFPAYWVAGDSTEFSALATDRECSLPKALVSDCSLTCLLGSSGLGKNHGESG
jgi:hypothetical protein